MRLRTKLSIAATYAFCKLTGKRKPLFVSWGITNRCNLRCRYCDVGELGTQELNTAQALKAIDLFYDSGTRLIRFTGGEPLIRDDIAQIICYAKEKGIRVFISTNGHWFEERMKAIGAVDGVKISVDGPLEVHDAARGKGSHETAIRACEYARDHDIPFSIVAVLNRLNLSAAAYLISLAGELKTRVFFQPATAHTLFSDKVNPLAIQAYEYNAIFNKLLALKRGQAPIGNSFAGLRYFLSCPQKKLNKCAAGKHYFRLDACGGLYACLRPLHANSGVNILQEGIDSCLKMINPESCERCSAADMIELNLLLRGDPEAVINYTGIR